MSLGPTTPSPAQLAWRQFRGRRLAYAALWGVFGLVALGVLAPLIASGKPLLWCELGEGCTSPWLVDLFDVQTYENLLDRVFNAALLPGLPVALISSGVAKVWRTRGRASGPRARGLPLAVSSVAVLLTVVGVTWLAPVGARIDYRARASTLAAFGERPVVWRVPIEYSPRDVDVTAVQAGASTRHPLGTDGAGRDVAARLLFGTRVSLTIGFVAVALYVALGTALGAVAGFRGGRVDAWLSRLIEVVLAVPSLFLVLTAAAFIEERSIFHVMLIIAAVQWTTPARLVRAEVLRVKQLDYVTAARAAGFPERAILWRHVLPNALAPVLVTATFGVASAVLIESTMSFLGLGDLTVPSWGQVLAAGRSAGSWPLIIAPGVAIFLTVGLLNLVGEGLRNALDPRLVR